MILKMIAAQILIEHGMYKEAALKRAGEIEAQYINEVSKMFVEADPNAKRPFKLDCSKEETKNDSSPRESTYKEPAEVPPAPTGNKGYTC